MMEGLDAFNQQAFGLLTSSKLLDALDIEKEDQKSVPVTAKAIRRTATMAGQS